MRLPKKLIKDFKDNVTIEDLSEEYSLSYYIINRELIKLGLKKIIRGGRREGCGRKKIVRGSELKRIREQNAKRSFAKQPEGSKSNPRSNLCRKYNNTFYEGGF